MSNSPEYNIFPLGDNALTLDFGQEVREEVNDAVLGIFHRLKRAKIPGFIDIVPAYSSLTIFYNIDSFYSEEATTCVFEQVKELVENELQKEGSWLQRPVRTIRIPVCYSSAHGPDLSALARQKGLTEEEVIRLHTGVKYRVYMIGFLPGFPYMGKVDERIAMARHAKPRVDVAAGSVGIAGNQTGIYPLNSPGGWQIIGRTPVRIFDREQDNPVLLQPGDLVEFYTITENEFTRYQSRPA